MAKLSAIGAPGTPTGSGACARCRGARCGASAAVHRPAVEADAPGAPRQLAGQHVEGRGLAGAVRPDDAVDAGPVDARARARRESSPRRGAPRHLSMASCAAPVGLRARRRGDRRQRARGACAGVARAARTADQALREEQHDGDEEERDADLPEVEAVAQPARQRADEQGAEHGPEQPAAAAHGGPDHEVGREHEAAQLRRDEPLLRRVERAADAGEQAADAEGHRLQPVGVEAEQHDPALVVGERGPQHAERRAIEPGDGRHASTSATAAT